MTAAAKTSRAIAVVLLAGLAACDPLPDDGRFTGYVEAELVYVLSLIHI